MTITKETITTPEGEKKGYENPNIPRITSDKLFDIFDLNLKRGNVVIIDGLKYHFNGKDKLYIDKNAAKSADIQGRSYEPVIILKNTISGSKTESVEMRGGRKFRSLLNSAIKMDKKYAGHYGWYEDPAGHSCQVSCIGFFAIFCDNRTTDSFVCLSRIWSPENGKYIYKLEENNKLEENKREKIVTVDELVTKIIPWFESKLQEREKYENDPEKERDKNFYKDEQEEAYKDFVSGQSIEKANFVSEQSIEKAKNILELSGIVLKNGWQVKDILNHSAGDSKGISIWVSPTTSKWNGKVYELRLDKKILQRQDGIDHSKF